MKKKLKELLFSIIASLVASFLWNYTTLSLQMRAFSKINQFLDIISTYQFLAYWFVFLLLVLGIRHFIRSKINQKQEPYPMVFSIPYTHDVTGEIKYEGFLWKVEGNIKSRQARSITMKDELEDQEVDISYIDGPYCIYDYRKMKEQRTYWGFYKYSCAKCGYKRKLTKNNFTLECELKDEIESKQRMKNRNMPME
ncbi:hypothetical protein [Marinilactibacillus psychrotolerans]|uniref:hypothetical protein n=1 Tax=Marinilactibacillus psychrotolerans TaxID=191770 RepID=UPI00388B5579